MRVGIVRTQVPFVTGGAERHAANLCDALNRYGHEAVEISLPFKWYPGPTLASSIVAAKLTDLSEAEGVPIDLLIGLKFPAYLARHPNKKFWIIHQHRQAYDQWDARTSDLLHDPDGLALRDLIHEEDRLAFKASPHPIYANSHNVAQRMQSYLGVSAQPLYHPPPNAERLRQGDFGDYLFAPGRLNPSKRLDLMLKALAATRPPVRLVIAGVAENPAYQESLFQTAKHLGVEDRVDWLGAIDDETMIRFYAGARAVVFVPQDEDYGYISLEAMLSGKPVITVSDAGGPLEFIRDGKEGLVSKPNPNALGLNFERVMQDKSLAETLGQNGLERYESMNISWEHVVRTLTGAIARKPSGALPHAAKTSPGDDGKDPQRKAVEKLQAAVAPAPSQTPSPFSDIRAVLEAYRFYTAPTGEEDARTEIDEGLASYLGTHWQRFLTTLDMVAELKPKQVLDVGVFPPLVFEAMLVNALPEVQIQGVWEGPNPSFQKIRGRNGAWPDFEVKLAPANIERDPLPYEDNQFDLVLGMEIFEHLALDPSFFLREANRVLRPGGHLLLSTPNVISHRGVWKTLNGHAPYSFGLFVPTGGVYGRHNREYAPREVERLAQAAGFDTQHLGTRDVYDTAVDPATAEMLAARNDDLALRGETIFYLGKKARAPGAVPEGFYHGNPLAMSGHLRVVKQEVETGLTIVEAENRSPVWWTASEDRATCLLAEWINPEGYLVHSGAVMAFQDSIAPGGTYRLSMRLDQGEATDRQGTLVLHLFQTGVGSLSGTGRANKLMLPCSETAFLKLVASVEKAGPGT